MKRQISIILFLLTIFCVVPVFAQKKQEKKLDLSGLWELDYSKTKMDKLTKAFHTKIENFSKTLFVEQKQNIIKVKEVTNWDWLDKKSKY